MTDALNKIIKARSKLMKGNVGMASILLHLELVEVDASRCDTMATDGKVIYYFPEFVMGCTEEELQGVLKHEALHVVYEHMIRRGIRHPKVWNIACDYVINAYLVYDLGDTLPDGGCLDRKYHRMTAEKVYQILFKDEDALQDAIDQIKQQKPEGDNSEEEQDAQNQGQGGDEEADETSETGQGNISDDQTGEDGESNGEGTSDDTSESLFDSIPSAIGEVWDATTEDGEPMNEAEMQELKGEIQRAVSMADKLHGMSSEGTSSGRGMAESNQDVSVDWKDTLRDLLQSTKSDDPSWSRLHRNHSWRGINLPSKVRSPQGGELAIAIDTSASVSQHELNVFATEIQAMAIDCGLDKIRVCYCDTVVRKNAQKEWWDIYELDQGDDLELTIRGGGGTRFEPPFNLFNDHSDDVDDVQAFIYFTDGEGYCEPDVEPDVPVFWCVTYKSQWSEELPFGEKIYVDTSSFY